MRKIEGEVEGYLWVYCDIDDAGKKWRLAIEKAKVFFFPVEDFYDAVEVFKDAAKLRFDLPVEPPRRIPFDECYSCQAAAWEEHVETKMLNLGFIGTTSRVVFECGAVVHHDEAGNGVIERPCKRMKGVGS